MTTIFWLIVLLGTSFALIYRRVELRLSTAVMGAVLVAFTLFAGAALFWLFILWVLFAGFALLNVEALRRDRISAPILEILRTLLPRLSETERAALEAGTVWWEGELFTGMPDWQQLAKLPPPRLTEAEQAFLDGPTEELCGLADEWTITHELQDMPEQLWEFIRQNGFFSLIIPEEYGGKGFSPLAVSMVLAKLASHSGTVSTMVGVPNRSVRPNSCCTTVPTSRSSAGCRVWPQPRKSPALPDFAPRRFRRHRADRQRCGLPRRIRRRGGHRHQAELGQALHHSGTCRHGSRPGLQALRSGSSHRRP